MRSADADPDARRPTHLGARDSAQQAHAAWAKQVAFGAVFRPIDGVDPLKSKSSPLRQTFPGSSASTGSTAMIA